MHGLATPVKQAPENVNLVLETSSTSVVPLGRVFNITLAAVELALLTLALSQNTSPVTEVELEVCILSVTGLAEP